MTPENNVNGLTLEQPEPPCGACGGALRWDHPRDVINLQTGRGSRQGRFQHTATCTQCGRGHAWRNLEGYGPSSWVMDDGSGYYRPL